jgi:hypothetical protein
MVDVPVVRDHHRKLRKMENVGDPCELYRKEDMSVTNPGVSFYHQHTSTSHVVMLPTIPRRTSIRRAVTHLCEIALLRL